jgi:hypothetical protein
MISTKSGFEGVSPGAELYASAFGATGISEDAIASMQFLARLRDVPIINNSFGVVGATPNGNSQLSLGFDWVANRYNVLNVTGAAYQTSLVGSPGDNFNC